MPIGTSPNSTYKHVLESDQGRPDPPAFIFKYFNVKEAKKFYALQKKQEAAGDDTDKLFDIFVETLVLALVGWENMIGLDGSKLDFANDKESLPDTLMELLTVEEVTELMVVAVNHGVTDNDKKKLDSQLASDTVASVKDVKEQETVPTSPPT